MQINIPRLTLAHHGALLQQLAHSLFRGSLRRPSKILRCLALRSLEMEALLFIVASVNVYACVPTFTSFFVWKIRDRKQPHNNTYTATTEAKLHHPLWTRSRPSVTSQSTVTSTRSFGSTMSSGSNPTTASSATQKSPTAPSKAIFTPSKPSFTTLTYHTPTISTAANIESSRSFENEAHTTTTTTSAAETKRQARLEEHRFDAEEQGLSLNDLFEQAKDFISFDRGPPHWSSLLSGG
ncbi:hypothetical protein ACFX2J_014608 [Malus domestica]